MADNKLTPQEQRIVSFRDLLKKNTVELSKALPRHIKIEQFLRVINTTVRMNQDLLECTPGSLIGCFYEAAQLGLQVDGMLGEAYLIPFNTKVKLANGQERRVKECQLIPGYRGYMKLALNSGLVTKIVARAVFEGDYFEYEEGLDPFLKYRRSDKPPDPSKKLEDLIIGAFALAEFRDKSILPQWLWKWEIERRRAMSKARSGPWFTHYPEMCEKSAVRSLRRWLPQSPDLQRLDALESLSEAGVSQGLTLDLDPETGEITGQSDDALTPQSRLEQLTAAKEQERQEREAAAGAFQDPGGNATPPADSLPASDPGGNPEFADSEPDPYKSGELS